MKLKELLLKTLIGLTIYLFLRVAFYSVYLGLILDWKVISSNTIDAVFEYRKMLFWSGMSRLIVLALLIVLIIILNIKNKSKGLEYLLLFGIVLITLLPPFQLLVSFSFNTLSRINEAWLYLISGGFSLVSVLFLFYMYNRIQKKNIVTSPLS